MTKKKTHKPRSKKTSKKENSSGRAFSIGNLTFFLLSLVLSALVFYPLLSAGFVNYDDPDYILKNSYVLGDLPFSDAFSSFLSGNYHPLTMVVLRLEYASFGTDALGFHLVSILLHLANTFLVFKLVSSLLPNRNLIAVLSGLFFLVHPMHVESVAWLSSTKDVLYTLFFLLSFFAWIEFRSSSKRVQFFLSLGFFVLALLSKPSAAILPLVFLAYDFLVQDKRKFDFRLIPYFLCSVLILWLTFRAQSGLSLEAASFSILNNLGASGAGFFSYLSLAFVPNGLSVLHAYSTDYSVVWLLSIIGFIALIFLAWKRKERLIAFALSFFLLNLLLVLQFISIGRALFAERYSYLAYVGLFLAVLLILNKFVKQKSLILIGSIAVLFFSIFSNRRAEAWQDSVSLWSSSIEQYSNDWYHYFGRGSAYYDDGRLAESVSDLTKAISLKTDEPRLYALRAAAFTTNQEYKKALADANNALSFDPNMEQGLINRGQIYFETGKLEEAFKDFLMADSLGSENAVLFGNLGSVYAEKKDPEKAILYFQKSLKIDPASPEVYLNLANVHSEIGKFALAEKGYEDYLSNGGQRNPRYHFFRGLNQKDLGQCEKAIKHFDSAIKISGKFPQFLEQKALCLLALGNPSEARSTALEAKQMAAKLQQGLKLHPSLQELIGQ